MSISALPLILYDLFNVLFRVNDIGWFSHVEKKYDIIPNAVACFICSEYWLIVHKKWQLWERSEQNDEIISDYSEREFTFDFYEILSNVEKFYDFID